MSIVSLSSVTPANLNVPIVKHWSTCTCIVTFLEFIVDCAAVRRVLANMDASGNNDRASLSVIPLLVVTRINELTHCPSKDWYNNRYPDDRKALKTLGMSLRYLDAWLMNVLQSIHSSLLTSFKRLSLHGVPGISPLRHGVTWMLSFIHHLT